MRAGAFARSRSHREAKHSRGDRHCNQSSGGDRMYFATVPVFPYINYYITRVVLGLNMSLEGTNYTTVTERDQNHYHRKRC